MERINFSQTLIANSTHYSNKLAIVDNDKSLTYGELATHIKHFAQTLIDLGLRHEQRIVLCSEDCVEWPVVFLAALAMGANPIIMNPDLPIVSINHLIELSDAQAIFMSTDLEISRSLIRITKEQVLDVSGPCIDKFYQFLQDEKSHWLLTSGSTAQHPSLVVHRHLDLFLLKDLHSQPYQVDCDSRILSTSKLPFAWGFHNNICLGLPSGATIYLINNRVPAPSRIFDRIDQYNITNIFTVPTILNSMIKHQRGRTLNKSVKIVVSSGEALPVAIRNQFLNAFGIPPIDGIGMAEAFNYCTQTMDNNQPGTVGQPLPGIMCELRDSSGNTVPVGTIGEMYVRHPASAIEYWNNWNKTKNTFYGPWVRTGDAMIKLSTGNYKFMSRVADLIKYNGNYISPIDIESCLLENSDVHECAVIAKYHNDSLSAVHIFVVSNKINNDEQVRSILQSGFYSWLPCHIHFASQLPKTVTGKINRTVLKAQV